VTQSDKQVRIHHDDVNNRTVPSPALDVFRGRLDSGDYDALLGRKLRSSLRQAAEEPTVEPEIGALRLAMVRLLREKQDPTRLANGISRLASVSVRAAQLRPTPSSEFDDLSTYLRHVLAEIDAEQAAASQQPDDFRVTSPPMPMHRDPIRNRG
jgi:hypothetical protein